MLFRSQPEPMALGYVKGSEPYIDLKDNLNKLITCLRPWSTSNLEYGVFEKTPYFKEGKLIGHCTLRIGNQWPEINYMFKKETWGKGFATEAVKAFMGFWWGLPRSSSKLKVHPSSVDLPENPSNPTTFGPGNSIPKVREQVIATIEIGNVASKKVLLKAGFESIEGMSKELIYFRKVLPFENPQFYRDIYFNKE